MILKVRYKKARSSLNQIIKVNNFNKNLSDSILKQMFE